MKVNIKKLNENARIPIYSTEFSAGADLCGLMDEPVIIKKGETKLLKQVLLWRSQLDTLV